MGVILGFTFIVITLGIMAMVVGAWPLFLGGLVAVVLLKVLDRLERRDESHCGTQGQGVL